jgi:RluA family pseudouridine synthase
MVNVSKMATITNIAAYRFAHLSDLKNLRQRLLAQCKAWGLKGTILLSVEGINLFVAGGRAEIEALLGELRAIPGLETLAPKFSESEEQPFSRMLVRIKKEIIAFGVEGIDPATRTSPKLPARELKRWLDEGRPVTLLDTRNDYEVKLGTFRGAKVLEIDHFKQFPQAVSELPEEMKHAPVVMFCTGGIRCEKAGPYMEREGFEQIYQLDGGILKYFEEVGGDHYDGECFVFDQRVGVDPGLRETESAICFACQTPLNAAEQADARFVAGVSCPHCYQDTAEEMAAQIAKRHAAIRKCTSPLPGSVPYVNERPLNIPAEYDRATLLEALCGIFPHVPATEWTEILEQGSFLAPSGAAAVADQVVRAGERYKRITPGAVEPEVNGDIHILHEDEAVVVVEKPAPLPMHPSGRFNRNTLQFILNEAYAPQKIHPAHRLDANTTGLVVCARTRHFAKLLQPQFVRGEVEKIYLARVQGHPAEEAFSCEAPMTTGPGVAGSRDVDEIGGQPARTEFRVLERFPDGTALLEARPITGRTHQIRVHLWRLGFPICGDATYLPDGGMSETQTLAVDAAPLCLHSVRLAFRHPVSGKPLSFETPRPQWAVRS